MSRSTRPPRHPSGQAHRSSRPARKPPVRMGWRPAKPWLWQGPRQDKPDRQPAGGGYWIVRREHLLEEDRESEATLFLLEEKGP